MTSTKNLIQAAAGVGGGEFYDYTIDYSARFDDNSAAKLTRVPSSAGNRQTFTVSFWIKRCNLGLTLPSIFSAVEVSGASEFYSSFDSSEFLRLYSGGSSYGVYSLNKFRDTSAWYHIVFKVDTTQATASDRMQLYVNGENLSGTGFSAPAQNTSTAWNNSVGHAIGYFYSISGSYYGDYYLAEFINVDGQALDPTSFGESKNGTWIPKQYTGSFGTNGFHLDFADSSNFGNDVSGNNNDWTSSGLTSSDQMTDTPTNNYPTFQVPFSTGATTYSEGNLVAQQDSGGTKHVRATFALPTSGKWYWEVQFIDARTSDPPTTAFGIGVSDNDGISDQGYSTGSLFSIVPGLTVGYAYSDSGYQSADNITFSNAVQDGDWFGIAYDADTREMWVWSERDAAWVSSGDPANGTNPWKTLTALPAGQDFFPIALTSTNDSGRWSKFGINFGQYAFAGTAPTDFLELKATNLPEPTVGPNSDTTSGENFNTVLYTGTGSARSVTGFGFQPDNLAIKTRSTSNHWHNVDAVRGVSNGIAWSYTGAEFTSAVDSFDSDGFSVYDGQGSVNGSGTTYVAYGWKANGSGVSNTDGSITSTVSANTDAGFSIVTYTGTGANATIGHGLGAAPKMVLCKNRDANVSWPFYHSGLSSAAYAMYWDLTNAQGSFPTLWNSTAPTSSVFSVGTGGSQSNGSGANFVAYCFAEVEGFSKFGTYTGNGSTDGPFVYTGFRPAWLLIRYVSGGNAHLQDSARTPYNLNTNMLFPNLTSAESTAELESTYGRDMLSNGFKIRASHATHNTSGGTYIYMAFAENPFKYSNAR